MLRCSEEGCFAQATHRFRLIAEGTGEFLELDFCPLHAEATEEYIKQEVPEAKSSCGGTIRVDSEGNQINEGMVQ